MAEEKVKKPKSKGRVISEWVITILFGLVFLLMAAGSVDGMIHKKDNYGQTLRFGYGLFVVETDSMEPKYKVGSAIITYKESADKIYKDFNNGKTVDLSFMDVFNGYVTPTVKKEDGSPKYTEQTSCTNVVMTHRLQEIVVNDGVELGQGKYTFIVAGINISEHQSQAGQYQAFTEQQLLGVVKSNSKFIGGIFKFISSPFGLLVMLLIPAGYLVVVSVLDIFKAVKDDDEETPAVATASGSTGSGSADISGLSEETKKKLKQQLLEEMLAKKAAEKAAAKAKEEEEAKNKEGE